jgi:peptidoglycan/xylan/chitin deacetylase (PgdA/CDA1 family)
VTRFRPLVLCYHAVSDSWPHALSTPLAMLERQVSMLARLGFRGATAEQAVAGRGRLLHVTFDDAFRSVARALPALERVHVPVTVFACPGFADGPRPLDVPELAAELAAYPAELETMGWDELRGLTERGVSVQSHTISHPHLPGLGDDELRRELVESRQRLEDELRRPVRHVAYPFGDENARVRAAARAAGYDAAFALPGRTIEADRFALPRVGLYRRDGTARALAKTTFPARIAAGIVRSR